MDPHGFVAMDLPPSLHGLEEAIVARIDGGSCPGVFTTDWLRKVELELVDWPDLLNVPNDRAAFCGMFGFSARMMSLCAFCSVFC